MWNDKNTLNTFVIRESYLPPETWKGDLNALNGKREKVDAGCCFMFCLVAYIKAINVKWYSIKRKLKSYKLFWA